MDENKKAISELNDQELGDVAGGFGMLGTAWHPAYTTCPNCQADISVNVGGFDKKFNVCKCPRCGTRVEFYG